MDVSPSWPGRLAAATLPALLGGGHVEFGPVETRPEAGRSLGRQLRRRWP